MRIGILGGTGPAGTALGARLASVGYEVVSGSRSQYRAMEARDVILARWPDRELAIDAGTTTTPPRPTWWSSPRRGTAAATTAHGTHRASRARS